MSAKLILNAVWARILVSPINTTLGGTALLGGRICLDQLPADTALPCVVYAIDRMDTGKSFGDDERFDLHLERSNLVRVDSQTFAGWLRPFYSHARLLRCAFIRRRLLDDDGYL